MALLSYTVTLGATAAPATTEVTEVSFLRIESEAGNDLVKFGDSTVSAASYAGSVVANQATADNAVILGPSHVQPIKIQEIYFMGTAGQKIHLAAVLP